MELRRLECFLAIVDHGTVTAAAEKLRIAPSAVSRQIGLLEHELGCKLFARRGRGLAQTAEGAHLALRATPLLRDLAQLRQDLASFAAAPTGQIRFGAPPSLRDMLTVPALAAYADAFPAVSVTLDEGMTMTLRDQVAGGALDLAVFAAIEPHKDMEFEPLLREALVLVGPADAGLAMKTPVGPERLLGVPLICSPAGNSLRKILERTAQRAHRTLDVRLEVNLAGTLLALVERKAGYGFLPYSGVHQFLREGRITAAPVKGLTIDWGIAYRKSQILSTAAVKLRQCLVQTAQSGLRQRRWPTAVAA